MEKKKKNPYMILVHLLIGIAFTLIMKKIPGPGGITELGMVVIAVFIVLNVWSTTVGLVPGAICSLLLFLLASGTTPAALVTSLLGNTTVYQMLIMFGIVALMKVTGVTDAISHWILGRKVFKNANPTKFLLCYFLAAEAFAILKVHTLIGIALADGVMKAAGYEQRSKEYGVFATTAFFVQCTGGSVIPFGSQILAIINQFEPFAGFPLDISVYMIVGIVLVSCNVVLLAFLETKILKCDFSKLTNVDAGTLTGTLKSNSEFTPQGKYVFGLFITMIVGIICSSFFKNFFLSVFINKISQGMWYTVILALMLIVPIAGKPVTNANALFKEGVQWPVFWSVMVMIYLTSWISKAESGISTALSSAFASLFGGMSPTLIMLVVIFATMVVTSFFANAPTAIMMMSATVPMASTLGLNATALGVCIIWASMSGILTPGGSGFAPYLHSLDTITKKDMYKTLFLCLGFELVILLVIGVGISVIMPA